MTGPPKEYIFKIGVFTPQTLPMERLAEYMHDLARLLGEKDHVHFVELRDGSAKLVHKVDYEAIPKVETRIAGVRAGMAPPDALKAQRDLDARLANDNTDGSWEDAEGAQILYLPGARTRKAPEFGPVVQQTVLDGIVRKVGGKGDKTVSVMLKTHEGFETHCRATREMGRELSKFYDRAPLRLTGQGRWIRTATGWHLDRFVIASYAEIDTRTLPEIVTDLRSVTAHLKGLKDPWSALRDLRDDDGK